MENNYIKSPIYYMGNKFKLLPQILPLFPKGIDTLYDVFGGSECVIGNATYNKGVYNEINPNIVALFEFLRTTPSQLIDAKLRGYIKEFDLNTQGTDVRQNVEEIESVREEYAKHYNRFRDAYNKSDRPIDMLFALTFYSFSNLIRFNSNNDFNMPYGNRCYTLESANQIKGWYDMVNKKDIKVVNGSAFDIIENFDRFNTNDFIYLDPPYSNTEAIYNEKRAFGGWGIEDDYRLFKALEFLNEKGIKWGLSNVFSNKESTNSHLIEWCSINKWNVEHLNFTYSALGKGNSNSDEVFICNYKPDIVKLERKKLF